MDDKEKLPKKFKIYLILLLIITVIFINPTSREGLSDIFKGFTQSEKELKLINKISIDENIRETNLYEESIALWEYNKLSILDFTGKESFHKAFKFKDPDIFFGQDTIYVMDKARGDIYLLDKSGNTKEQMDLEEPFYRFKEEKENIFIFKKDGDTEKVDILDKKGELLTSHQEKIPILTANKKDKRTDYMISTLDMYQGLKSVVTAYSKDEKELFSSSIKDQIILYSEFIKDNVLIGTEKSLYFLDGKDIKWEKKYEELKDIKLTENSILLLYKNKFERLNFKGDIREEVVSSVPVEKITSLKDQVVLFGKNDIIIPNENKNLLTFKSEEDILDLKEDKGNLLLLKKDKMEIYKIEKKGE